VPESFALQLMIVSQLTACPQLYPSCAHVFGVHEWPPSPLGPLSLLIPLPHTLGLVAPQTWPAGQSGSASEWLALQLMGVPQFTVWPQLYPSCAQVFGVHVVASMPRRPMTGPSLPIVATSFVLDASAPALKVGLLPLEPHDAAVAAPAHPTIATHNRLLRLRSTIRAVLSARPSGYERRSHSMSVAQISASLTRRERSHPRLLRHEMTRTCSASASVRRPLWLPPELRKPSALRAAVAQTEARRGERHP
jgi:hypothetical protein